MNYQVHIKQLPHAHVVTKRAHTSLDRIGDAMNETLAEIEGEVTPPGAARGAPFAIYYNEPFRPDDIDVELGVPIAAGATVPEHGGIMVKDLPGGSFAYTTHVGSYGSLGAAYDALFAWIAKHGLKVKGPPRESYLVGPSADRSPSTYRTEIAVPVE
jgi:effector-binding domain-containing protein